MKRAIIVRGNPRVGKTPILIAIYQWLKAKYLPVIIYEELYYKDINDPTSGINDLFGVLQFGKLVVGIYSAGDEASAVKYYIDECKTKKCDIIVGACRRRRSTFDTVRAELPHTQYVTDWCHPEALSPILSVRIAAAILEIQTRLIGLPL